MKIKQSIYLVGLFVSVILCFNLAQAEEEHGVCFYPKTGKPSLRVSWFYEIPTQGQSKTTVLAQEMDVKPEEKTDILFRNSQVSREEESYFGVNGSKGKQITINWFPPASYITIKYDTDKFHPTKSEISFLRKNGEATCIITNSAQDLLEKVKSYEFKEDVKSFCTSNATAALISFTLGVAAVAYYCGAL